MAFSPASRVQDYLVFGEFGDVNPSITDSSTYTFLSPERMEELFEHEIEGCFLYSRHFNPTNKYLASALERMEDGQAAQVMASGMGAISTTLMTLCSAGDEIVCGRSIYGGTYALLKNLLPRFGVNTRFVDLRDHDAVRAAMTPRTRVLYCESLSNPLLEVSDLPALAAIAHDQGAQLVVDNTFTPMILSPLRHGADIVVHSLTKFVNGTSDCVAGCVVSSRDFIGRLTDINAGPSMLLGPVLDSTRAASILKNLHSLHIRLRQHGANALYLASRLEALGHAVHYPGLASHPHHDLLARLMNPGYGCGGMLTLDAGDLAAANRLMTLMQRDKVGYLAVSLGYFKTLFNTPGHSTSSEIPPAEREAAGLREGLIRFSIGLDEDIEQTTERIESCLIEAEVKAAGDARS
ncbi:PLP-dependent transferase [Candidatus Accumulibacter sp. ACC003]|uniref:PLP-dependent transferase n=1 Tax=Candidatus Accumulibacter sp. ACC003 TaxID=2823334 RepID=UPI0025C089D7|nr:PLP-dependent transferase [Candidatus Accumulibacter sp. ACC003]